MNDEQNQMQPGQPGQRKSFTVLALVLAFVPSMIFLSLKDTPILSSGHGAAFKLAFVVSLACCFISSSLLFRRKVGWAIVVGILFFFLNAIISFMLGCAAIFMS